MIHVASFSFNPFQENTYILYDETKECIIIDPGCYSENERKQIKSFIQKENLKPVRLLNTHCHLDHICGNAFIAKEYQLVLEAHQGEKAVLDAAPLHGKMYGFNFEASPEIEKFIEEGDLIEFGTSSLKALFTPGHSPASLSFYSQADNLVIAGDVLFFMGIGRTDLPGGNHSLLLKSIQEQLFTLPDDTLVYNGHGQKTQIGFEKKNNPFF
ncbi:MAG: MBL fold metallo-hydrolase [Chitinophagales bacterium]|nr:MBL fold metallo-hydrolase [Chitinophagales bacterium]